MFDIKKGVRQGCILSPHLLSSYTDLVTRNTDIGLGLTIGGRNIINLRYADDTALNPTSKYEVNSAQSYGRKKSWDFDKWTKCQ